MDTGRRLAGKVVVVTGGASGMGASHARSLAQEGAAVAITDIASDAGEALAEQLRAAGHAASYHHLDVTDPAGWQHVVADVERARGAVGVLVNNAGVQVRSPRHRRRRTRVGARDLRQPARRVPRDAER